MSRSHTHRDDDAHTNTHSHTNVKPNTSTSINANANANAPSSSNLSERVEDTLAHLLIQFLPQTDGSAGKDKGNGKDRQQQLEQLEQEADDRFYAAFERAVGILEGEDKEKEEEEQQQQQQDDVNASGDLIKKKRECVFTSRPLKL